MKKYIALTALLAAGTALANASTVLTTTFSNAAQSDATAVVVTTDVDGVSASITSLTSDGSDLSLQTSNAAGTTDTFVSPNVNVGTGGSWTLTLTYTVGSDDLTINGVTLDLGLFNSTGVWQGSTSSAYEFIRYFDLTLSIADSTGTLATYSVEDEALGNPDSSVAMTNESNEVIIVGTEITLTAGETYTVTLTAEQGASNNDLGCYIGVTSIAYTIPEPSAFGILAGAGALALVAARRRRAKKA